jgi:hypothetical protein
MTRNHGATAILHTLQITAANTKSSPACSVNSRSLATASNSGDSSISPHSGPSCPPNIPQLTLNFPQWARGPRYIAPGRTQQKTPPPTVPVLLLVDSLLRERVYLAVA